jgi:tripartite-type tricarboxylate transporter receptor subunit TctC
MAAIDILGINAKIVTGYAGATERALAIAQGEVAGAVYNMEWAATQAKEGQLAILVQIRADRDSNYKDTPALGEIVKLNDHHKSLLAAVVPDGTLVAAPPATPADKVKFLSDSFAAVFADKNFQAEIVKVLPPWLGTWSGIEVDKLADTVASNKPRFASAYADLTKKYVK